LASIRRILGVGETSAATAAEPPPGEPAKPPPPGEPAKPPLPPAAAPAEPAVFALEESMLVQEPPPPMEIAPLPDAVTPEPAPELVVPIVAVPENPPQSLPESVHDLPAPPDDHAAPPTGTPLLMPETTAAAASSVGSLLRTLGAARHPVHLMRGGPTLEDMVREELRPALKAWLDTNLPALVERLVRTEIERVVSRATDF
jgi:cell pole-organizing protein PopZ